MTNTQSVVELLKDDNEYYKGIGKNYLSNSDIRALLSNPTLFKANVSDSKALAEGRYFHQMLIEPEKAQNTLYVDVSTRNTKAYKEYIDELGVEFALLLKEKEDIDMLVKKINGNIEFFDSIYKEGNLYEQPAIGEIKGFQWKGKADIITDEFIIDLKTTSDIAKFKYSAKTYNYDSQCYIYQMLFGKPLLFYVIDKQTAQLGIFRPTDSFVRSGEIKLEEALEVYHRYFGQHPTDDIDNYYIDEYLL